MSGSKIGVLHLTDSLVAGGAEHAAVMIANNLPRETYRAYVCASRHTGPLQQCIKPHVIFYDLRRRGRFDLAAIWRLVRFTRREHIRIIHAHATSLFLGAVISLLNSNVHLVWHDHYGCEESRSRPWYLYRPFARRARAVFCVTRRLAHWAVETLSVPMEQVHYLPNFAETQPRSERSLMLPGVAGKRVVCVANVREQKDHLSLVRAWAHVTKAEPQAHLFLVGAETEPALARQVKTEIRRLMLDASLTWMGSRDDVPSILANCDIGVLGSISEGFPLVLLEYGRAGLAAVATRVGECAAILEEGRAGILVPASNPEHLATAVLRMLGSSEVRHRLGKRLAERVVKNYDVETVIGEVCQVYERIT